MNEVTTVQNFTKGLEKLGFDVGDDALYLVDQKKQLPDPQIRFHLEKALEFGAVV